MLHGFWLQSGYPHRTLQWHKLKGGSLALTGKVDPPAAAILEPRQATDDRPAIPRTSYDVAFLTSQISKVFHSVAL